MWLHLMLTALPIETMNTQVLEETKIKTSEKECKFIEAYGIQSKRKIEIDI